MTVRGGFAALGVSRIVRIGSDAGPIERLTPRRAFGIRLLLRHLRGGFAGRLLSKIRYRIVGLSRPK